MADKGKPEKEYPKELTAVLAQIKKEFGEGAIMRMGDAAASVKIPTISTGSFSLEWALH
jgi:recombination protein RecA